MSVRLSTRASATWDGVGWIVRPTAAVIIIRRVPAEWGNVISVRIGRRESSASTAGESSPFEMILLLLEDVESVLRVDVRACG